MAQEREQNLVLFMTVCMTHVSFTSYISTTDSVDIVLLYFLEVVRKPTKATRIFFHYLVLARMMRSPTLVLRCLLIAALVGNVSSAGIQSSSVKDVDNGDAVREPKIGHDSVRFFYWLTCIPHMAKWR